MDKSKLILAALIIVFYLVTSSPIHQQTIVAAQFNPATAIKLSALQNNTNTKTINENDSSSSRNNFLTYVSPTYNVRIQYPVDWEKTEPGGNLEGRDSNRIPIVTFSPESGKGLENVIIGVENLPPTFPNDKMAIVEYALSKIKDEQQQALDLANIDIQIIDSALTSLVGVKNLAFKVVLYADPQCCFGEDTVKSLKVYTIKDNKVYIISYSAEPDAYPFYLPIIEKMLDSFEIIEKEAEEGEERYTVTTVEQTDGNSNNDTIDVAASGRTESTVPNTTEDPFAFNYTKIVPNSPGLADYTITYNSTLNELAALAAVNNSQEAKYTIELSELDKRKLKSVFIENESFKRPAFNSPTSPFPSNSTIYRLSVTVNNTPHTVNWTNTFPELAPEGLLEISNAIVDTVCTSVNNPIACETTMLEFR
ncbi:MAG: hypothetical protein WA941_02015 [Nitrososphaeraceae archaeon]